MIDDDDFCEACGIEYAEVTNDGQSVCRVCDKELKRQARKIENRNMRKEDREEKLTHNNHKGKNK